MKLDMIVEIPKFSSNKYEYSHLKKKFVLNRVLQGTNFYPEEYGYVEETLDHDGDPLDVVCLNYFPTFTGCVIPVRIIGVLLMIDQGEEDHKLIAVNDVEKRLENIKSLSDVSQAKLDEISNFFARYKELEGKKVEIKGYDGKEKAQEILKRCQALFKT